MLKKLYKNNINDKIKSWMFVLPSLLGCLLFIFIPTFFSFFLSFCNWNLLDNIKFVGFFNYLQLFNSDIFYMVIVNTVVFSLSVTILGTIIPTILASILNEKIKGSELFKTLYFIPFITPMIAIGIVWQWIFDPNIGFLNMVLKTHLQWLYSPQTAMISIIIVSVWKLIGYNTVIMLTGFANISKEIYEASEIDGAGKINTFFKITLPMLSPTIFFVLIITTINSFQVFDLVYLMTQGGPSNSTNIIVYWLYKNAFEYFNIGKASALAYILFTIIAILTFIQWKLRTRWVENEND